MAADKSDEPGVLGNLPRSRPGHRSDKRGGGSRVAAESTPPKPKQSPAKKKASPSTRAKVARAKTSAKSTRAKAPAVAAAVRATGKPKQAARSRTAPSPTERPRNTPPRQAPPRPPEHDDGPLTGAVRLAGKVADVGLKTAGGLLRRLPGR